LKGFSRIWNFDGREKIHKEWCWRSKMWTHAFCGCENMPWTSSSLWNFGWDKDMIWEIIRLTGICLVSQSPNFRTPSNGITLTQSAEYFGWKHKGKTSLQTSMISKVKQMTGGGRYIFWTTNPTLIEDLDNDFWCKSSRQSFSLRVLFFPSRTKGILSS